jgi:hypothetical protein
MPSGAGGPSPTFSTESWRLAERTDILTDLILRHGFTVGWDIGGA